MGRIPNNTENPRTGRKVSCYWPNIFVVSSQNFATPYCHIVDPKRNAPPSHFQLGGIADLH